MLSKESLSRGLALSTRVRNVLFILCGVAGLTLKGHYRGPYQALVRSYYGNIAASFAVYFLLSNLPLCVKLGRLPTAGCALAVVGFFEATDGFHLMTNTYDPMDYGANSAGIGLALLADAAASKIIRRFKPDDRSA